MMTHPLSPEELIVSDSTTVRGNEVLDEENKIVYKRQYARNMKGGGLIAASSDADGHVEIPPTHIVRSLIHVYGHDIDWDKVPRDINDTIPGVCVRITDARLVTRMIGRASVAYHNFMSVSDSLSHISR